MTIPDHQSDLTRLWWSPARLSVGSALLGAVGLQLRTLPVGWDAQGNSWSLRALAELAVIWVIVTCLI